MVHITVTVVTNKETQNMRETSCVLSSVRMTENSFDVSFFFQPDKRASVKMFKVAELNSISLSRSHDVFMNGFQSLQRNYMYGQTQNNSFVDQSHYSLIGFEVNINTYYITKPTY